MVQDEKCDKRDGHKIVICQWAAAAAGKANKVRAVIRVICTAIQEDADEACIGVVKRGNVTAMHIARAHILLGEQL